MIPEEKASGLLRALYERIGRARGGVAHVMKVHSLHPEAMEKHFELYRTLMFKRSELSRPLREMIGVIVSAHNQCTYCVAHHLEPLKAFNIPPVLLKSLEAGEIPQELPDKEQALLQYAIQLTQNPSRDATQIQHLKDCGWSERAILDATLIISYFNFANRIVLGLGVSLEPDFERTCQPHDISG